MPVDDLPDAAFATAIASLPGVGPSTLARCAALGWPVAWERARADGLASLVRPAGGPPLDHAARRAAAGHVSPARCWERVTDLGIRVLLAGDPGVPEALAAEHAPPPVLFVLGDLATTRLRTCGVVGTRTATALGRSIAHELGNELGAAGIAVVSGLAAGIDGAAHEGALASGGAVIGVVGSGLDVAYPSIHRRLWRLVAERGLLVSEAPPGARPEPWRFPVRNRLIAALSEVVVVVESRLSGGSITTADEAIERGRTVMAVPGSVRSATSEGTNKLLADGIGPCRDALDVLVALGLASPGDRRSPALAEAPTDPLERRLLAELQAAGASVDRLTLVTGASVAEVCLALGRLEGARRVTSPDGVWFEAR